MRSNTKVRAILINSMNEAAANIAKANGSDTDMTSQNPASAYFIARAAFNTIMGNEEILKALAEATRRNW